MEKAIKTIINSFVKDFDQSKLDLLENTLFSLLLNKELYLLKNKKDAYIRKVESILKRYFDYRGLIYNQLASKKGAGKDFLISKIYQSPSRLIVLLTHLCQLRCKYCRVSKFSASMSQDTLFKAINLLFSSNSRELQLQFFGGEPLLRFDLLKQAVFYAKEKNKQLKRNLLFILTTNGIQLTEDKLDFLKQHEFIIEYSIDGEVENQLKTRESRNGRNYYQQMIDNFRNLKERQIPYYSISVFMPENVSSLFESFLHLVKTGFQRLQINYSLGFFWPDAAVKTLLEQTEKIVAYLKKDKNVDFINLSAIRKEPVVLNAELTVDCNGGVYLESGICLEEDFSAMKRKFLLGDVKHMKDIKRYQSTWFQNFYRLSTIYGEVNQDFRKIILNNIFLGKKYKEFLNKQRGKSKLFAEQGSLTCSSYAKAK